MSSMVSSVVSVFIVRSSKCRVKEKKRDELIRVYWSYYHHPRALAGKRVVPVMNQHSPFIPFVSSLTALP